MYFFQLSFGLLRLGSLVAVLSEAMVSGFTTAAAIHVFSSQIKYVVGISTVARSDGAFKLIKVSYSVGN
jgi:MFS superfamily sulfate permease-like transporter